MSIVTSTIKLYPSSCDELSLEDLEEQGKLALKEAQHAQQYSIDHGISIPLSKSKFSNAASRTLPKYFDYSKDRLAKSRLEEMDRSEAYRLLLVYHQRKRIAEALDYLGWNASFEEVKNRLGEYLDFQNFRNVQRSKKHPSIPEVKNPLIVTSKAGDPFLKIILDGSEIVLSNFGLWDERLTVRFQIPEKWLSLHRPNLKKISRPNIQLENGRVVYVFTVQEEVAKQKSSSDSVLGIDLGISKTFSASRIYSDGRYSEEFIESRFTGRHRASEKRLNQEIGSLLKKQKRREELGFSRISSQRELDFLRAKKRRVAESTDWSVSQDILNHAKPDEIIAVEKLNWSSGPVGKSRFRHSSVQSKLEHKAHRLGRDLKRVNAAYTSRTCPLCSVRVEPDSQRKMNCRCGWSEDRDYTASLNIGLRRSKTKSLTPKKNRPTPKRPKKKAVAKKPLLKKSSGTTYTGVDLAESTDSVEAIASSVLNRRASSTSILVHRGKDSKVT